MSFIKWWWRAYHISDEIAAVLIVILFVGVPVGVLLGIAELETYLFGTEILYMLYAVVIFGFLGIGMLSIIFDKLKEIKGKYDGHKRWESGKPK